MINYKFTGNQRVNFSVQIGERPTAQGSGTIIACISDYPIIGQGYVILCDDPQSIGIHPFPGIVVYEKDIIAIQCLQTKGESK